MAVRIVGTDSPTRPAPQGREQALSAGTESWTFGSAGRDRGLGGRGERAPERGEALPERDARQSQHLANLGGAEPRLRQERHGAKGRRERAQEPRRPGPRDRSGGLAVELPQPLTPALACLAPRLKCGLPPDHAVEPAAPTDGLPITEATRHRFDQGGLDQIACRLRRLGPAPRRSQELGIGGGHGLGLPPRVRPCIHAPPAGNVLGSPSGIRLSPAFRAGDRRSDKPDVDRVSESRRRTNE